MFDLIKEAKKNKRPVVFEKYQIPEIKWEDMMNHIYNESVKTNRHLIEKAEKTTNRDHFDYIGNIQIQEKLWLSPQQNNLFEEFVEISDLLYILNQGTDNRSCGYYRESQHDCSSDWHIQGIRMSLSNRHVKDHHDPHDIFYWQILGTSFWKIDNDITYTLNPGDLLFLPLENSHQVLCEGPRAGLLIDNLNKMI
jgi:mannose-6-phosphate isomerase-like protein (cupin superfamily)